MSNKKVFIILFLFLQVGGTGYATNIVNENFENKEIITRSQSKGNKINKRINKKINKKLLKKEIKKRKRFHRNLVEVYNNGFSDVILNNIIQNGLILENMKSIYKNK